MLPASRLAFTERGSIASDGVDGLARAANSRAHRTARRRAPRVSARRAAGRRGRCGKPAAAPAKSPWPARAAPTSMCSSAKRMAPRLRAHSASSGTCACSSACSASRNSGAPGALTQVWSFARRFRSSRASSSRGCSAESRCRQAANLATASRNTSEQRQQCAFQAVAFRPLSPPRSERHSRNPCERSRSGGRGAALAGRADQQVAPGEIEVAASVSSLDMGRCSAPTGSGSAARSRASRTSTNVKPAARGVRERAELYFEFLGGARRAAGWPRADAPRIRQRGARAGAAYSG